MHRARDRGHYRPRQPEGDRALHQSGGSTETGGFGNGENENTQWPTLRKVSQKTQKAVRDQGGFMWGTNRRGRTLSNDYISLYLQTPSRVGFDRQRIFPALTNRSRPLAESRHMHRETKKAPGVPGLRV